MHLTGMRRTGLLGCALALALSVPARSQIAFEDVTNAAGLTQVSLTYGLAWGDYDGDGWPDLRIGRHGYATTLYRNNQDGTFADTSNLLSPTGGLADWHTPAWGDFDNDGDQDLVVIGGGGGGADSFPNMLFVNQNGSFSEQAVALGIDYAAARGRQPVWWDWNDDGLLDLVVISRPRGGETEVSTVFEQTDTGFVSIDVLPADQLNRANEFAQLGDLTGDGVLELLTGGGPATYRILEKSAVPFADLNDALGLGDVLLTKDAVVADLTGDLLPDLYLVRRAWDRSDVFQVAPTKVAMFFTALFNEYGADIESPGDMVVTVGSWNTKLPDVYIGAGGTNPSTFTFSLLAEDPNTHGLAPHVPGVDPGVYIGYDPVAETWRIRSSNWNWVDASFQSTATISALNPVGFTIDPGERENHLYVQGPGTLTNATAGSGLETPDNCDSVVTGDFDNDMDLDLYQVCQRSAGTRPNLLYENQGAGTFVIVPNAGGAAGSDLGRGDSAITADYDRDGFLDIFVSNGYGGPPNGAGPDQLFRNLGNANHWIELDLEGVVSNRDGIGAHVLITAGGVTQHRARDGGMHARAQNHKRLHFGLGPNTLVDQLVITWPSGIVQQFEMIPADQILTISELGGLVPEPASWLMLVAGAALLGVLYRRRAR